VANAAPAATTVEPLFELVGLPSEIDLGDEVEVEIRLKSQALVDIMGYGFDIAFDSEKVAVSDSMEGDFLANSGKTFFVANQLSKKLTVGNALIHGETNDASKGTLLRFKLKPVVSGDTVLTIDNLTVIQRDGNIDFNGVSKSYSIRVIPKKIITKFALLQNYPNPFNPETWIPYALKNSAQVKIHIYNMQGQVVRKLDLGFQKSAEYVTRDKAAYWDGRNNMGEHVASGIYFYRIQAEDFSATRRMLVVK
ncbi:MAG: T9SS type A sorting domain-containing protein, partial [Candidatus Poribacteria bacterium]